MNELTISMKKLLANVFFFYYKSQAFHWNVEGPLFKQYHDFFGDIYSEIHESLDDIAEKIRVLDQYAPTSIAELYQAKTIQESNIAGNESVKMLSELYIDNKEISANLLEAFSLASSLNNQGLADYLAGRQDAHAKLDWMIKSHLK